MVISAAQKYIAELVTSRNETIKNKTDHIKTTFTFSMFRVTGGLPEIQRWAKESD